MFKKFILVAAIVLMAVSVSQAADFDWSSSYFMKDNINYIANADNLNGSAGVFVGTLAEVRNDAGDKLMGVGGISFHVGDNGNLVMSVVPVTVFDDMIQFGVTADMSDFRWNNAEDYLFSVGFSASELVDKLWK